MSEQPGQPSETLDLESTTAVPTVSSDTLPSSITAKPYDQERARDKARENIAYALVAILAGSILATLVLCAWLVGPYDADGNADRLVRVLNIVFGPIITLVGSATGFYFGAQTASRGGDSNRQPPG